MNIIESSADYRVIRCEIPARAGRVGAGMTLWWRTGLAGVELQLVVGDADGGLAVNEFE